MRANRFYRLYFIDSHGHITGTSDATCTGDEQACSLPCSYPPTATAGNAKSRCGKALGWSSDIPSPDISHCSFSAVRRERRGGIERGDRAHRAIRTMASPVPSHEGGFCALWVWKAPRGGIAVGSHQGCRVAVVQAAPRARWAAAKTALSGQPDAMASLTRRTLMVMSAPILNSLRRMVPQVALANSVACRARRRRLSTST